MSDDIELRVFRVIANMGSGGGEVDPPVKLNALGFDSLDATALGLALEEEFGLTVSSWWSDAPITPSMTVGQIVGMVRRSIEGAKP